MRRKMDIDNSKHDFKFTTNKFRDFVLPEFWELVYPDWAGRPITYLEIGVFEGQSLVWMLQKILTHEDSRAVGIDPWKAYQGLTDDEMEVVGDRAHHNLSPWRNKLKLVPDRSENAIGGDFGLMQFIGAKYQSIDICFLDGDPNQVLVDAMLCWPLLKIGGWMIFGGVSFEGFSKYKTDQSRFAGYHEGEIEEIEGDFIIIKKLEKSK